MYSAEEIRKQAGETEKGEKKKSIRAADEVMLYLTPPFCCVKGNKFQLGRAVASEMAPHIDKVSGNCSKGRRE